MSEGYSKSMDLLRKFSGKTTDVELTDDDGNVHKIKMYPLPNKYMAELLELQKLTLALPKKKDDEGREVINQELCSPEQRKELFEANRKIVALSLSHSLKKANGLMSDSEFEEVKQMVDELPLTAIQQVIVAISGINEVPLTETGDSKKA
jgi:hypothetical protein